MAGGILNMVTKTIFQERRRNFNANKLLYKPSIDVYGPLNDIIAYRFTGSYENSESFRDNVTKERYYINPSFCLK
jgi:iron complex outermembrane receptor protein